MGTLTRHVTRFVTDQHAQGRYTATSVPSIRSRLRTLDTAFGNRPLTQLTERAVLDWLAGLNLRSPASRNAYLGSARVFCRWMLRHGHIATDPTIAIPRLPKQRTVPRALARDQVAAMLAACADETDRLIVWLEVGLGLRRSEVAGARWEDYDSHAGLLLVRGKGGHQREVGVPSEVARVLAGSAGRHKGPLVPKRDGSPFGPAAIGARASKVAWRAGVKRAAWDGVSGHALRHTCASDVLDAGADLRTVQEMLGHAQLATTSIYLRRAGVRRMREAMEGRDYSAVPQADRRAA